MLANSDPKTDLTTIVVVSLSLSIVLSFFTAITLFALAISPTFGIKNQIIEIEKASAATVLLAKGDEKRPGRPLPAVGLCNSTLIGFSSIFEKLSNLLVTFGSITVLGSIFQLYVIFKLKKRT